MDVVEGEFDRIAHIRKNGVGVVLQAVLADGDVDGFLGGKGGKEGEQGEEGWEGMHG